MLVLFAVNKKIATAEVFLIMLPLVQTGKAIKLYKSSESDSVRRRCMTHWFLELLSRKILATPDLGSHFLLDTSGSPHVVNLGL